jgi:hypothetical protein
MKLERTLARVTVAFAFLLLIVTSARAQAAGSYSKAVVGDHIRKVEDGVDEFRKYLERRGDDAQSNADARSNTTTTRRGTANPATTEARKDQAKRTKDELEDALDDLNGSTNRLRRRFDGSPNYMETRSQMENVMESARRVNQVLVRGKYGTQAERYWAALRKNINDLARTYGLTPMAA